MNFYLLTIFDMFRYCSSLTLLDLSNFNTSQVKNIGFMFEGCSSLTLVNLSNFDTSQVTYMKHMFYGCSLLSYLNLSNFDTSQVVDMRSIFYHCSSLTSIELSRFNISLTKDIAGMFYNCSKLKSLDLSNFDTSSVTDLLHMFRYCSSLVSLNLSNFDTPAVTDMGAMFENCSSLTFLDLSNFNTSQVKNMGYMFSNCVNLEFINLKNFDGSNVDNIKNIFLNLPENIVICINKSDKLFSKLESKCYNIDCSENWKLKKKIIINDNNNECFEICDNNSKYEYIGRCYDDDKNENLFNNNLIISKYKCELDKFLLCPLQTLQKNICTKCNSKNYYQIENDTLNSEEYINCYEEPEGYYFDQNDLIYKKCYYTCKSCNAQGNYIKHNCQECNDNFTFMIENNNYKNCYVNCSYYHYFDGENNYHCTLDSKCPDDYPQLIENKMECIKYDIKDIIKNKEESLKNETDIISKTEEIKYYNEILEITEEYFKSENYDTSRLDNGEEEIIETEKMTITFTSTQNEINKINNNNINTTTIDFGECETLLREDYNLWNNETLYLKKIEFVQEGMKTSKVEYDIYCKLFGKNLIKLNLTSCVNTQISIFIPIELTESLDKLNSSSGYYNDICYTTTSEDGTDITLTDRRRDFIDKNKAVCQEECQFSKYDEINNRAQCLCNVKETSSFIDDFSFNKEKLFKNFKNLKNILNFSFLVCYKILFNENGIINNIGSYILLIIILINIISVFIFYIQQFPLIKQKIKEIILAITEYEMINEKEQVKKDELKKNKKSNGNEISVYKNNKKIMKYKTHNKNDKSIDENGTTKVSLKTNINRHNKNTKILEYIDEEINDLSYNLAIQSDKRTFCQYYISLVKTKHNLMFALLNKNDYNSIMIKIDLFFIGFSIDYIVNALFYTDDTMHKIYKSKGVFDLETQLPIIVYSTIITYILNTPLNFLALSNDAIISFKQNRAYYNIIKRAKYLKKMLAIKFVFYLYKFNNFLQSF